jgi:Ser-Thr-rich glycosyl-phosphatidyl-inositol-anchored membrane family
MKQALKTTGLIFCFVMAMSLSSSGQNLDIDFIEFVGRNVVVHYTLDDGANSSRQFLVQLYASQDNFSTPLTRVTGDFGSEVSSGVDKKIVWDITKELGAFKGNISLELRGRVYVPFVKIKDLYEGQVFKRGKNYPVNWTSGNLSGQVNIELFNEDGERIWGENNVANVGKFDWYIQGNIKKGHDYKLKFTNARDRNDVAYSLPFTIKPKIPLAVKAAGVVAVAAAVGIVVSTRTSESNNTKPYEGPPSTP